MTGSKAIAQQKKVCLVCAHPSRKSIENAMVEVSANQVAQRYKIAAKAILAHKEHAAVDRGAMAQRDFDEWMQNGGRLALSACHKASKGRKLFAYTAPLLGRLAQFTEIAGQACGALQSGGPTTNVQANVLMLPRGTDDTE